MCKKRLPDAAIRDADLFCSRACACANYGTEHRPPARRDPTDQSGYGCHSRMMMPADPAKPLTRLQRARISVDRLARVREGLKVR
jgi:hypothetical protein